MMYGIIDLGLNKIHLKIYKKNRNRLVELVDLNVEKIYFYFVENDFSIPSRKLEKWFF